MSGVKPLLPVCVFAACYGMKFTFSREHMTIQKYTSALFFPLQFFTEQLKYTHDAKVTSLHRHASSTKAIGLFFYII